RRVFIPETLLSALRTWGPSIHRYMWRIILRKKWADTSPEMTFRASASRVAASNLVISPASLRLIPPSPKRDVAKVTRSILSWLERRAQRQPARPAAGSASQVAWQAAEKDGGSR